MMSAKYIPQFILIFIICAISSCLKSERVDKKEFPNGSYLLIEYYRDGKVKSKSNFASNGLQHGEAILYHPNGNIRQVLLYKMGAKYGESRGYKSNGDIDYVGSYKNNKQDSTWSWYNRCNNHLIVSFIENYNTGVPWGGQVEYSDSTGEFLNYSFFGLFEADKVKLLGKIEKNIDDYQIDGALGYVLTKKYESDSGCNILVTVNIGRPSDFHSSLQLTVSGRKIANEQIIFSTDYSVDTYGYFIESCDEADYHFVADFTIRDDKGVLIYSNEINETILTSSLSEVFPARSRSSLSAQ